MVSTEVDAALEAAPGCRRLIESVRPAALDALVEHRLWLSARLDDGEDSFADPRIGPERFARKLSLTLDAEADAGAILARAHADLDRVSEEMAGLAAELAGPGQAAGGGALARQVLDRLAGDAADDATILEFCRRALAAQTGFVNEGQLVTTYDDPVEVIEMPEIARGVAVAYCDSPGPLEPAPHADLRRGLPHAGRLAAAAGRPRSTASTTGTWCRT